MPTSRRPRRVFPALLGLLVMALGAAACNVAQPPPTAQPPVTAQPVAVGPCGLVVTRAADGVVLEPRYAMRMTYRPSGDEARIEMTGTGWGRTRATMTGPGKTVDTVVGGGSVDDAGMNSRGSWVMPAVGTWHFRFADDRCTRDFDVEVMPRL